MDRVGASWKSGLLIPERGAQVVGVWSVQVAVELFGSQCWLPGSRCAQMFCFAGRAKTRPGE